MTPAQTFAHSIDSRLTPGATKELYTSDGKRSLACWARTIDLSSVSLTSGITAISPQHVAMANHLPGGGKGTVVPFRSMKNEPASATIVDTKLVPGPQVYPHDAVKATDILIGLLDKPLPPSILPAYVLPPGAETEIQSGTPAMVFDQEDKALIADVMSLAPPLVRCWRYVSAAREVYYEEKIAYDSGNPIMLVWNNVPVMLAHLLLGGAGAGPSYCHFFDAINATMVELGGGFTLTPIDSRGVRPPVRDPVRPPSRKPQQP